MIHIYFLVHFEFFPKVMIKKKKIQAYCNCSNKDVNEIQATRISCFLIACILDCGVLHRISLFPFFFINYCNNEHKRI